MKPRSVPVFTQNMLEVTQNKKNLNPMANSTSSQRLDLFASQFTNLVLPLEGDTPNFDSSLSQEYLTHSSWIRPLRGVVTVHHKLHFQHRTIYVYDVDGRYDVFDNSSMVTHQGFSQPLCTDLAHLELGVPYQVTSKEPMYLKYPKAYDPITRTVKWGHNVLCTISTNKDNAQDSVAVTESFVRKFGTLKTKTINLNLNQKVLFSSFPKIFPEIGKILSGPILLKIVQDEGMITKQIQTSNVPIGYEDEIIVLEENSYLSSIEIFSNEPLKDPHLEQLRQDLLHFRREVYNTLHPIVQTHPDSCSPILKQMCEHYRYDKFRSDDMELVHPYIRITMHEISLPDIGTKFSNLAGGKVTIQEVMPDGSLFDEYGRNIEMEYPSTAIVNRSVGSILYEVYFTSIAEHLVRKVRSQEISKDVMYEFLQQFYSLLGKDTHRPVSLHPNGHLEEWEYLGWDADTWWEYLQTHDWKIMMLPFSSGVDLETEMKTIALAEKMIGYRKLKIFRKEHGTQVLGRDSCTEEGEIIQCTDTHTVGRMFMFRDMHDPQYGNSSTANIIRDIKGFPLEKNSSKRDGRSFFTDKAGKMDIQIRWFLVNMASNADAHIMMEDKVQGLYQVRETMEAGGIALKWEDQVGGTK